MKLFANAALLSPWAMLSVSGHGFVLSPRALNVVATPPSDGFGGTGGDVDGNGGVRDEHCPHCLNRKDAEGVCGKTKTNNYDEWLVPFNPEPYSNHDGDERTIIVDTILDTYHQGHMELRACPITAERTQDCFDMNPLTFLVDLSANGDPPAIPDISYPERGYYGPADDSGGAAANRHYKFVYKFPDSLSGDVTLQYQYVTANSCNPVGYPAYFDHFASSSLDHAAVVDDWWKGTSLGECTGYPNEGLNRKCKREGTICGEHFWNCVEIEIPPIR